MSLTLIMAVTAAVAATMGYMAARRRGDDGHPPDERDEGKPDSSKKPEPKGKPDVKTKAAAKGKPEPKGKPEAALKAAFAGLPLSLGDVVSAEHEERWLAGALLVREQGRVIAALFIAPEGARQAAVVAFAAPRRDILWMDPAELTSPEEPPATIELGGTAMRRKGRLPVTIERLGQGAPSVAEEGIWALYDAGGKEAAVVITSQGRAHAWVGRRLEEEEYDRLGEG